MMWHTDQMNCIRTRSANIEDASGKKAIALWYAVVALIAFADPLAEQTCVFRTSWLAQCGKSDGHAMQRRLLRRLRAERSNGLLCVFAAENKGANPLELYCNIWRTLAVFDSS
jgi:hypothetical protein